MNEERQHQPSNTTVLSSVPRAKLKQPAFRSLLHRPQLVQLLDQADQYPLTLLLAPAGYGKSAAIADWSNQDNRSILWLNIDENDNDPARFSLHLLASLSQLLPVDALPLPPSEDPGRLADSPLYYSLIKAIESYEKDLFLVLEDFDFLHTEEVLAGIAYLLHNYPENLHLIVSSRGSPNIPLSTLRARGLILEIHKEQLQFDVNETRRLLNDVLELQLSELDIRAIHSRTEGWMAGIRLLGTALMNDASKNISDSYTQRGNDYIRAFLYEEVFSRLEDEVREFLMATSILECFTVETCRFVTEQENVSEIMEYLIAGEIFIEPLDHESGWYRYQTTFADALQEMLHVRSARQYRRLHGRAAEWYASQGMEQYAAAHAVKAGKYERAAELLGRCSAYLLNRGELTSFTELVKSLPLEILRSCPFLAGEYGIVGAFTGSLSNDSTLQEIEHILNDSEQLDPWLPQLFQTVRQLRDGNLDKFLGCAHETLEMLPKHAQFYRVLLSQALFSIQFFRSGDVAATRRSVERMLLSFPDSQPPRIYRSILLARLGHLYLLEGLLRSAHDYYMAAAQTADAASQSVSPVLGLAYNGLSEIYREWDDMRRAREYAEEGLLLNLRWRTTEAMRSYLQLASIYYSINDITRAEFNISRARDLLSNTVHASYEDLFLTLRYTELYLIAEDIDQLPAWKSGDRSSSILDYYYHFRERTRMIDVHIHLARGEHEAALEICDSLLPAAASRSRYYSCLELHTLKARALYALDRIDEAMEELSAAYERAESEGFLRLFLDQGERIRPLLQEAETRKIRPLYTRSILQRLTEPPAVTDSKAGEEQAMESRAALYQLSQREVQVLALLASGLTNREIADRLCISLRTVKWHTSNIFEKLGAKNRTEAVHIGQRERIISPT